MAVQATSNLVFENTMSDTMRSKCFQVPVSATGLQPGTSYAFYLDSIDYSWASKPYGGNLGDPLIPDQYGSLNFYFLYDFQYEGNYSFDDMQVSPQDTSQYQQQGTDALYYMTTNRYIQLISAGGSEASAYVPLRLLIIPSHVNRIQGHSH